MKLIKQINNNAALAIDNSGKEVVLIGRGLGFPKMPYELNDLSKIERSYYGIENKYIEMISNLPEEIIDVSSEIVETASLELDSELNPNLAFTLADHIKFAIERIKKNIVISNAMMYDVKHLYPREFEIAKQAIKLIEDKLKIKMPEAETVNITLNIVDGELEQGNLHKTMETLKVIESINEIVERELQVKIDKESFSYSRFAMHLRYLVQRLENNYTLETDGGMLYKTIAKEYPDVYNCAKVVALYLEKEKNWICNQDELLYLMIHINRVKDQIK